jgi:iron complex transport system substrate-binding protein
MSDDETNTTEAPTRRDYMKYGGAVIGGGLLAGCAGQSDSESTPTETSGADDSTTTESTTSTPSPFEVTVEPYGKTTFETPPKTYATSGGVWTDIGFAFGSEPVAMSRLDPYPTRYYDRLPDVSFDPDGITNLGGPSEYSKEQFYELDVDAILMDKILLASYAGWESDDFEEVGDNVAPFCGSYLRNGWSGEALGMEFSFPYYTLTGAVELAGEIFQDQERASAWASLHGSFRSEVSSTAPSARPSIGLLYSASKPAQGNFMVSDPTVDGVATRQYRTLDVTNAFADIDLTDGWKTDYEGLLEADPEYLFFDSTLSMTREEFESQYLAPLEEHAVGQELTAVKQGNVFRGGGRYQGPIINLFQTETLAKQLYPETFGRVVTDGDVPEAKRLFDRQRVADIINGDI